MVPYLLIPVVESCISTWEFSNKDSFQEFSVSLIAVVNSNKFLDVANYNEFN